MNGQEQQLTLLHLDEPMSVAAVSPDGRYIAINTGHSLQSKDGSWESLESLQIVDSVSSKFVANVNFPTAMLLKDAPLSSTDAFVSYCNNGEYLVAYDEISALYVLNAESFALRARIDIGALPRKGTVGQRKIRCAALSNLLAVEDSGGQYGWGHLRVFDLPSGIQTAETHQDPSSGTEFHDLSVSPSGSKVAVLLADPAGKRTKIPNVEIREAKGLKLLNRFSTGDAPFGVTFSGEMDIVTIQSTREHGAKQAARLWNVESHKEEKRLLDARADVEEPASSSSDGTKVLASLPSYKECRFCNGLEGRRDLREQRFAVWDKVTGSQIFRSEAFGPVIEPFGARCVISWDGGTALIYWPDSNIMPRLVALPWRAQHP